MIVRGLLIVLGCVLLGGCYLISEPVFDKGAYAPLAGEFVCKGMFASGKVQRFVERKSGFLFASYSYEDTSDGSILVPFLIQDKLYAVQVTAKDGKIGIVFADFLNDKKLLLLIPDLMSKGPYLEELAKKSNVTAGGDGEPGTIRLQGKKDAITAFIRAHDKSLLSVVMDCDRRA